jgi:hypothetical protein
MHDDSTEVAVLGCYLTRRSVNAAALKRYAPQTGDALYPRMRRKRRSFLR